MGAVPSHLRGFGNKLKIVNNVTPPATRSVERLDLPSEEENSDVNLLVSITRDKTVIISEGKTVGTQTEQVDEGDTDAPNAFVLISENSQAPIETTFRAYTPAVGAGMDTKDVKDDESQTEQIKEEHDEHESMKTPETDIKDTAVLESEDKVVDETDIKNTAVLENEDKVVDEMDKESVKEEPDKSESVKTPYDEEAGFVFEPYDPTKIGDPINYDTAALERYGKYKVKLSRDTAKCIISAATFLDSGELIIIDRSNQRIKYIDANFQYISSYDLPHKPWAVCARGGDVYVSMGNTMLQHVFVKDMIIEPERVLEIAGRCLGICIVGEFIAVGLQIGEIALIDTVGIPQRTLQLPRLPKGSPCNPWHLSVTREQNILITDSDAESIFCINMDSEVLFTFQMFSSPRGTAVDNQGNIILAGRDQTSGHVVVTLSRDFELQNILHVEDSSSEKRGLLTWAELEFVPYCVAYRSDNVVVLGGLQEALKIMRIVS